jgi:uncharacterized protein YbjT (DUF2867 family)
MALSVLSGMTTSILVTGGTGTLGRLVVHRLLGDGRQVRVLSRRPQPADDRNAYEWVTGDLRSGAGIDQAVTGADVIIHCATSARGDLRAAGNLIDAARQAGGPHLIYISVVGVDRIPFGYYRVKLEAERLIERSGLPFTIVRATQFHDLIVSMCLVQRWLPVLLVPAGFSFQPVDVRDVADRLAGLATGPAAGRVPDLGGPDVRAVRELARRYLRASGRHRRVLPVRLPGRAFAAFRRGGNLAPDHAVGRLTFDEYLAERFGR